MTKFIDIVFDGPPSTEPGRFVEVEDDSGASIRVGEWLERPTRCFACDASGTGACDDAPHKPLWTLRIPTAAGLNDLAREIHEISTSKGFTPPDLDNLPEKLMLSVSELAEALEEHRSDRPLIYYKCEVCGATAQEADQDDEDPHFVAGSKVVNIILRFLRKGPHSVPCPGRIAKPEGILVEIADSTIRNLHMMHSIISSQGLRETVEDVHQIKVGYNADREAMHGRRY